MRRINGSFLIQIPIYFRYSNVLIFFKCIKIIWRKKTKVENEYPKKVSAFTIICPNSYDRVAEICTALMAVRGYDFPRSLTMKRSRKEGRSFLMTTYQSEKSSFPCYAHFPWHNGAKKCLNSQFHHILFMICTFCIASSKNKKISREINEVKINLIKDLVPLYSLTIVIVSKDLLSTFTLGYVCPNLSHISDILSFWNLTLYLIGQMCQIIFQRYPSEKVFDKFLNPQQGWVCTCLGVYLLNY